MIELLTSTISCGFINVLCIHRNINLHSLTEQQRLCKFVENTPEWCKSKAPPIYPILKKDRT